MTSPATKRPMKPEGADATHDWFFYVGLKCDCCRQCGIVRRADRMNRPCKGPVRVIIKEHDNG